MTAEYKEIAARKCAERDSKIPVDWKLKSLPLTDCLLDVARTCGLLSDTELEITELYDAVALLEQIKSGHFTVRQITTAFCKRTAIAQQVLNCVTEFMFDSALQRADELDDYFQKTGKLAGPLHGLPVSLKDSMNVEAVDSSIGITALAFQPEKENSGIVDGLLKAGAVLLCKTNVPQSMMVLDTENFTFGRSRNPHSEHITTAGSSGGAGALVAFRGCLIGMATDIGGSIRAPAYANGVYGFKPSSGRLPYYNIKGYWQPGEDLNGILCVDGPVATSMRDCHLLVKAISETRPWTYDPTCLPLPWPVEVDGPNQEKPLSIGVISHPTFEPVTSILRDFCLRLKKAGHEIVPMELKRVVEMEHLATKFFQADGGSYLVEKCNSTGEPLTQMVQENGLYPCKAASLNEFFSYSSELIKLEKFWLSYWESSSQKTATGKPVDVLLTPVMPWVPRAREFDNAPFMIPFNVLDYPAMVFPVTKIDGKLHEIEMPPAQSPREKTIEKLIPENPISVYEGFPLGLQLVGQKLQEPALFEAFNRISGCL